MKKIIPQKYKYGTRNKKIHISTDVKCQEANDGNLYV